VDLIGDLLRASLLGELGDDEARVGKLRAAAARLAEALRGEQRPLVPAAVLTGFDEHTSAESTVVAAATEALQAEWETFRAAFSAEPTEVMRAVAMAAVQAAAADEPDVLLAAWYTARTCAEQCDAGRWDGVLAGVVDGWVGQAASEIDEVWVPRVAAIGLRMPALQPLQQGEKISLNTKLREKAEALDANWQAFAQQLAPTFAEYVDGLIGAAEVLSGEAQRRAVAQVKEFATELGAKLRDALGAQQQAATALHLRADLLWWRQSRYSDRLGRGYGELPGPADVAIAAAYDLHRMVPVVAPVSVEHVLADLVAATAGDASLRLSQLAAAEEAAALPDGEVVSPAPLLVAVRHGAPTPVLSESADVMPARAAVLLFRDLQARRLAAAPPPEPEEPAE